MSLKLRFFLGYGVGGVTFLFIISWLVFQRTELTMERQLTQQFEVDANDRIEGVMRQFSDLTERFQAAARLPTFKSMRFNQLTLNPAGLKSDMRHLELYFYDWIRNEKILKAVSFIDMEGVERFRIDPSGINRNLSDHSRDPQLTETLSRVNPKTHIMRHYDTEDGHHDLTWRVPVLLSNGKSQGLLQFYIYHQQVMDRFRYLTISATGEACVVLEDQYLLFSSSQSSWCEDGIESRWKYSKEIKLAGQRWKFILSVDPQSYLGEIQKSRKSVFLLILPLVSMVALILIAFATSRFTARISRLVKIARNMGGGEHPIVKREQVDELDILKNEMVHSTQLIEQNKRALENFNQKLEVEVEQRTNELVKVNRAKDEFLASMSHELRTPLTSIIGNSEILTETPVTEDQGQLLHTITVSGRSLLSLINDILDLSKIESGKFEIDFAPFDLATLLDEVGHIFSIPARDSGLLFETKQQVEPKFQIWGDGKRIGQILINLLGNAIKFTE
ncbi:MAG: hypothetical protein HN842_04935 [Gammaproteobacteria bacterium]|jgi:signal transduction histidine kinase|nr:hypothetical protein [Gammaproteobacteria bacterium]